MNGNDIYLLKDKNNNKLSISQKIEKKSNYILYYR